jgi:predicted nucleic acid-binding protein
LSRYCLDTSAYSHFKRGEERVVSLLEGAEWIGVPSIVLGELWMGFLAGGRVERNVAELREFLANPVVNELVVDGEVARVYAEIAVALRRAGTPIPTNDIWIAATAANVGAIVLTHDDHFDQIQRVGSLILSKPPAQPG